jgi:glutamate carboxypeptidase
MNLEALTAAANANASWMERHLRELVEVESPSEDRAAVNAAMNLVAGWTDELNGRPRWHRQKLFGDVLELRFGPRSRTRQPILLVGHLDTVWPVGTLAQTPWREDDGRLYGPGILDMKAGVVMALAAVKCLQQSRLVQPITLLLVSDEEVGSPVSRAITERLALQSEAVFVLEPAQGLAYKTARKGVGAYTLRVSGMASHSGVDFAAGHSAIREAARLVETISGFTDLARGLTVNCGVIAGGTRSNVVAAECTVQIDVRIARAADARRIDRLFRGLRPTDPGCAIELTGGINRPPMERRGGTIRLFRQARRLAAGLGFELEEASTGGGSDGNFTAALNVPTLDGMGAVGQGAHAAHEHIVKAELVPRTALLAAMLGGISGV